MHINPQRREEGSQKYLQELGGWSIHGIQAPNITAMKQLWCKRINVVQPFCDLLSLATLLLVSLSHAPIQWSCAAASILYQLYSQPDCAAQRRGYCTRP